MASDRRCLLSCLEVASATSSSDLHWALNSAEIRDEHSKAHLVTFTRNRRVIRLDRGRFPPWASANSVSSRARPFLKMR